MILHNAAEMKDLFNLKSLIKIFWLPILILSIHAVLSFFKVYGSIW